MVSSAHALEQPTRPGCDPISPLPLEVQVPKGQGIVCGDGKIDDYIKQCWKHCGNNGCGNTVDCATAAVTCTNAVEKCDKKNLGGMTCQKLGFFGGALKCQSTCEDFDIRACEICRRDRLTTCHEAKVPQVALQFLPNRNQEPALAASQKSIGLAWDYALAGTTSVAFATVSTLGEVRVAPDKIMKQWMGASQPRVIADPNRFALVGRREFKILIQEFSALGEAVGALIIIPGDVVVDLQIEQNQLKVLTRSRYSQETSTQFVPLSTMAKVNGVVSMTPVKVTESHLAMTDKIANRFAVQTGEWTFEGGIFLPNAKLVVAIKKSLR